MKALRRLWRWLTDRHHDAHPLSDHRLYPRGDPPSDRGGMGWSDE